MRALLLPIAVAAACVGGIPDRVPSRLQADITDEHIVAQVQQVRSALERGAVEPALAAIEELSARGEGGIDLQRLRQDALRQRGRSGWLRSEAAARAERQPEDAAAHYLLGRLLSGSAMEGAFRRAAALAPELVWPWLGLAFSLRDRAPAESLAIYERVFEASGGLPVVAIAYANALRGSGRLQDAIAVYERLAGDAAFAGVGQLGLAQTLFAIGGPAERQRGWSALLEAMRSRPFDVGVHAVLRELLRLGLADEQVEQCLDVLRAAPERAADFARGSGAELLADLLQRAHQPHAALQVLASRGGSASPSLRRQLRRLHLQVGDVRGFLAALQLDLPADLLADESNQVAARWHSLLALAGGPDPLDVPETAVALVAKLRDAGLLAEAEQAVGIVQQRHGSAAAGLTELADEVRREVAFEDGVRRVLHQSYGDAELLDLDGAMARIRALSSDILGRDVVGEDVRFRVPLVGEMLDPFRADLCRHFARYNRYLVLGRRAGGRVEGLAMTRLCVRDLPAQAELPLPGRCREVVGWDRSVRSLSGVLGGDLAGVALLHHYVVDYDAVVEWAGAIAARRRAAAADGNAVLGDPLPDDATPLEAIDVNWRLAALSSTEDNALLGAVLEIIRLHERRHLVDSFHYLPLETNLWRGLSLLFRFGFSPATIEAEMENRAELAALALCREPRIVLAHVAEFVGGDEASPHAVGFTALAERLMAALVQTGVPARDAAISRWHALDPELVQRCARRLLAELP